MIKTYRELIEIPDFNDRFEYLRLAGKVGGPTFGSHRYLNQLLYRDPAWKSIRNAVIIRDRGCDLAHPDYELGMQSAYVHHINPITREDILERAPKVFNLDNLITTSFQTHQAIHYGTESISPRTVIERTPGDTCPWRN